MFPTGSLICCVDRRRPSPSTFARLRLWQSKAILTSQSSNRLPAPPPRYRSQNPWGTTLRFSTNSDAHRYPSQSIPRYGDNIHPKGLVDDYTATDATFTPATGGRTSPRPNDRAVRPMVRRGRSIPRPHPRSPKSVLPVAVQAKSTTEPENAASTTRRDTPSCRQPVQRCVPGNSYAAR